MLQFTSHALAKTKGCNFGARLEHYCTSISSFLATSEQMRNISQLSGACIQLRLPERNSSSSHTAMQPVLWHLLLMICQHLSLSSSMRYTQFRGLRASYAHSAGYLYTSRNVRKALRRTCCTFPQSLCLSSSSLTIFATSGTNTPD